MPDLNYGYEVTIAQNATSNPPASVITNQWQKQVSDNSEWDDIRGASGETYTISGNDRSAKIRLQQDLDGAEAYSNELQVTSDEFDLTNGLGEFGEWSGRGDGGVLAPNGKIYVVPHSGYTVLEIDPVNRTTKTLDGALDRASEKWWGGVLAPNGKIYGIPYQASKILEVDPVAQTVTEFGDVGTGYFKWKGGVLGPNGKIYGIPYSAPEVLEIDPTTLDDQGFPTTRLLGYYTFSKWSGGVLAPNGKIYGIPSNTTTAVLEIDPIAGTTSAFGFVGEGVSWAGGVLGPNGKIYGFPDYASFILEIDPDNKTTTLLTFAEFDGNQKWRGGVLGPNGKIYGIPYRNSGILEFDPINRTAKTFSDKTGWSGGVLAPNGKIYGIPYGSRTILEIDLGLPEATGPAGSEKWALPGLPGNILDPRSAYFNKF